MDLFGYFERRVLDGSLPHFFVCQHNLFSPPAFSKRALAFLTSALKEQRELGLPVLKMPSPSAALVPDPDALIHSNPITGTDSIVAERYFRHGFGLVVVIVCVGIGCISKIIL